MLNLFAGDRVIWPFVAVYIPFSLKKNTNTFTDFEVWQIENIIKPTYQHKENYLSMCFVTSEPRRHAENRNVCTLNDDGFIYIVFSDICLLFHSTNIKTKQCKQNIFLWESFDENNTFSWLVRLASNRQAKLWVTLRNALASFSAKRTIDSKN